MKFAIDSNKLQRHIDDLAAITEAEPPAVTRVLFSEADLRARAFVKSLCRELALSIRKDAIGNLFARWVGKDPSLPPVATGSHIDAIPNAGRYDGVVGVLGALEAMRALQAAGFEPKRSIELIVFTAEEPTRFGIGCLGSRLLAGLLTPERVATLRDRDGLGVEQWLMKAGFPATSCSTLTDLVRLRRDSYAAFIELHIEQGPLLEQENTPIGVVERIAAPGTLSMRLAGAGGHAGAVLMSDRRDALLAGAEVALVVERAAKESGSPDTVGTTGVFRIEPGAVNSIPNRAALEIDVRDTRLSTRDAAVEMIERSARDICARRGIEVEIERLNMDPPAICDAALVRTILAVCAELDLSAKKMISRAYHDSLFMARICPTTMIFIPSHDGVSHRPDEFSSPKQIAAGVEVLGQALARCAMAS